jgi:hypothetical protein
MWPGSSIFFALGIDHFFLEALPNIRQARSGSLQVISLGLPAFLIKRIEHEDCVLDSRQVDHAIPCRFIRGFQFENALPDQLHRARRERRTLSFLNFPEREPYVALHVAWPEFQNVK